MTQIYVRYEKSLHEYFCAIPTASRMVILASQNIKSLFPLKKE
uniref:Uncharacterized protein n=1 Tax=Rhizophora mucronata TaxID=61149 RepID=A0A2P2PP47_RHIMU